MGEVMPPLVEVGEVFASRLSGKKEEMEEMRLLPPPSTSAVTRSWSHVDRATLFMTFTATSFAYSICGHPIFLAVSRQQCSAAHVSVRQVVQEVYEQHGVRGVFRGAGAAVSGTVISELLYYIIVEYGKEYLPFQTMEQRSLIGGFAADLISGPIYNPFGVVSQVQMVADSRYGEHCYRSAYYTTRKLVEEQGWRVLFRGTLLTALVSPLTGAWWLVYELLKQKSYNTVASASPFLRSVVPGVVQQGLPSWCTSTTDNPIVNCAVGSVSSMAIGVVMNPLYVLRLRLQVSKKLGCTRFPAWWVFKNILQEEGVAAFFKGIRANLFIAALGGSAFGLTYEGAKQFSDIT